MDFNATIKENTGSFPSILKIAVNVAVTYAIMLLCLFIFAVIVTYTDFPEGLISTVVLIMTILSIMLAGVLTARGNKAKGWLCGALSGILYMVTLYILSCLAFRNVDFGINAITMLAIGLFSGTFGGILGINMKGVKRK